MNLSSATMPVQTLNNRPENTPVIGISPLRARPRMRDLLSRELLTPSDLMAPILLQPTHRPPAEYAHLPGTVAIDNLAQHTHELRELGIRSVRLFSFVEAKTPDGSGALRDDSLLIAGFAAIREAVPDMVIASEICGCAWTITGECVLLDGSGRTDRDATYSLMSAMALLYAQAGVDIVGPAAVLDGSVRSIRGTLDQAGYPDVSVTPSVIFDSALFGPYKQTMNTDPGRGNRRGFQLDACQPGQALDLAHRWLDEGADSLLVQPAMMSIDLLTRLRGEVSVPITTFSVSGEHTLFHDAAEAVVLEYHRGLKRAGADLILSYGAIRVARSLTA